LRRNNLGSAKGDWKLVWTTLLPTSTEVFDLSRDPTETTNLAGQNPEKVKELQAWIIDLAKQAATPLFLTELVRLGSATLRIFRTSAERMIEERRTGWQRLTP
jgi:hypothetical protein